MLPQESQQWMAFATREMTSVILRAGDAQGQPCTKLASAVLFISVLYLLHTDTWFQSLDKHASSNRPHSYWAN